MTGLPEAIASALPVAEIYRDVAKPAAIEVGEALGSTAKVARLLLAPIDYLAALQGRWKRYLERVAAKVPEDRQIEAHPQVVGPVLSGLLYVDESGINAELFINLLACAIDRQRVNEAHPAFGQLISQLSPDEALILFHLKKGTFAFRQYSPMNPDFTFGRRSTVNNEFPLGDLVFPENFHMYMDHLNSLGLAGIWQVGNQEAVNENSRQTGVFINSAIRLAPFGETFAQACVPDTMEPQWTYKHEQGTAR